MKHMLMIAILMTTATANAVCSQWEFSQQAASHDIPADAIDPSLEQDRGGSVFSPNRFRYCWKEATVTKDPRSCEYEKAKIEWLEKSNNDLNAKLNELQASSIFTSLLGLFRLPGGDGTCVLAVSPGPTEDAMYVSPVGNCPSGARLSTVYTKFSDRIWGHDEYRMMIVGDRVYLTNGPGRVTEGMRVR